MTGSFPAALLLTLSATLASGAISYSGTLASSTDTATVALNLAVSSTITIQSWSFGGGTNANNAVIPSGGFDPFIGVFTGSGPTANIVFDALDTYGTSDQLTNYGSFTGCPPAGTVTIGRFTNNCGDITMTVILPAGSYTVLLSNGAYIPNAVFDNGTLSEGFSDFTGGAFQTCVDADNCITPTADWAFDINSTPTVVPEPSTFLAAGFALLALARRNYKSGELTK